MADVAMTTRACAEYLRARLEGHAPDPKPYLARIDAVGDGLRRGVELGYGGVHADHVALCLDIDRFDFATRAQEDGRRLVLRKV